MGIYLPNMEMPENCICCDLSHEDGWCPAKQTYTDRYTFKTCPLIPVPPHGDLIDRDALMIGEGRYIISFGKEGIDVAEISRVPTIIPAEPPKEE